MFLVKIWDAWNGYVLPLTDSKWCKFETRQYAWSFLYHFVLKFISYNIPFVKYTSVWHFSFFMNVIDFAVTSQVGCGSYELCSTAETWSKDPKWSYKFLGCFKLKK